MVPFRKFRSWLWILLIGSHLSLSGQQPAFRRFGLQDGLPQSQVTALLEDSRGFLWVGTNTGGVARLGAQGFEPFGAAQGMKAIFVRSLVEDKEGTIWVASQEGVSAVRGNTVRDYRPQDGLKEPQTNALALDGQGSLLVANRAGLFRWQGEGFEAVQLPAPWPGRPIRLMASDGAKGVWFADSDDRIARWDGQAVQLFPLPPSFKKSRPRDLEVDAKGRVWVLFDDALVRQELGQWLREPLSDLPPVPKMSSLRFDARGEGFLVTLGGDGLLIKEPGLPARRLTHANGLPRDRIISALRDRRGVLWVGSDGDGLAAQSLPSLFSLGGPNAPQGQDFAAVTGILELDNQRFLLSSSTGLYEVTEGRGITGHWSRASGLSAEETWALLPDGSGGVWVGTDRGLSHWKNRRVTKAGPSQMQRAAVLTLLRKGSQILAGTERGLFILDGQGRLLSHDLPPAEVGDEQIADILVQDGRILLSSSRGILELQGGKLVQVFKEAPFADGTVTSMVLDSRGWLWIGTMKGLHVFNGKTWMSYGIEDGLPDDGINFIVEVGRGRMAFGHGKGVSLVEGRRLHHLSRSQGLLSDETNHGSFLVDSKARLWIGMIGGVNLLKEAKSFRNPSLRQPSILQVNWPGGSIAHRTHVQVSARPDYLDISFDTGAPLVPSPIRYEAYLQGAEEDWRPVAQGRFMHYLNLGAGRYQFMLRASLDGATWVEARPLSLEVLPAWHERWLVRGALLLGLLTLVGWMVWLRLHRLSERAQQLEEVVDGRTRILAHQNRALEQAHEQIKRSLESRLKLMDMVTHDLRSPLTSIMLSLDRLRELIPGREALLNVMDREAHRIETLVRNLLDQSRSEALLHSLVLSPVLPAEVTEGFEDVLRLKAEAKGLDFHLQISPDTERVSIQADVATLHQVMLNLFENALKFTPSGGKVGVRSTVDRNAFTWNLEIWDTGRGLDASQIQDILEPFQQSQAGDAAHGWGLGLSICQNILEAHHGYLKVESEPGRGASFTIVLPLDQIQP